MTDRNRRITEGAFGRGPLPKILAKQARAANLSKEGRARVETALKAGAEAEAKKFGLQHGVGSKHADALIQFPTSKRYSDRRSLKPKEREVIENVVATFYKRNPSTEPKVEEKIVPAPKIEPKLPDSPPKATNDDNYREAA